MTTFIVLDHHTTNVSGASARLCEAVSVHAFAYFWAPQGGKARAVRRTLQKTQAPGPETAAPELSWRITPA